MNNSRAPKKPLDKRECKNCKESFSPYRDWQVYCSPRCRALHYWNTHEVVKTDVGDQVVPIKPVMPEQQPQTKTTNMLDQ